MAGRGTVPLISQYYVSVEDLTQQLSVWINGFRYELAASADGFQFLDIPDAVHVDQQELSRLVIYQSSPSRTLLPVCPPSLLYPCRVYALGPLAWVRVQEAALVRQAPNQSSHQPLPPTTPFIRGHTNPKDTRAHPSTRPGVSNIYTAVPNLSQDPRSELTLWSTSVWQLVSDTTAQNVPHTTAHDRERSSA